MGDGDRDHGNHNQLADNGRLIIPVGGQDGAQQLLTVKKTPQGIVQEKLEDVLFVPLVGGQA